MQHPTAPSRSLLAATLLAAALAPAALAESDDFNDGNDAGWTRFDLNGVVAPGLSTYTFPDDGHGGKAYRLQSKAPPVNAAGPARAFSHRPTVYTRMVATVDVLDWLTGSDQAWGILFRANTIGLGQTEGYVFNYNSSDGDLQLNRVAGEAEAGTIAETPVPMDPAAHDYRWVLSIYDDLLVGQVYQLPDTNNVLASVVARDATTASGQAGLFNFDRDGRTGGAVVCDTTFDNFTAVAPPPGSLTATVVKLSPPPAGATKLARPEIRAAILNRETAAVSEYTQLFLDGREIPFTQLGITDGVVMPNVAEPFPGLTVTHTPAQPLAAGNHTARLIYGSSAFDLHTNTWNFQAVFLDGPGTGSTERGFAVRLVQAEQQGSGLGNSLARAEAQLGPNSPYPARYDTNVVAPVINYSQNAITGGTDGTFPDDLPFPGQEQGGPTDNWAMEVLCWLDLPAGDITFGVQSDDGYSLSSPSFPADGGVISQRDGGTANETFSFHVATAGKYPFRLAWYENTGGAHVEWFHVNSSSERVLLNTPGAPAAFVRTASSVAVSAEASATVNDGYAPDAGAVVDAGARTVTLPLPAANRFYRLTGAAVTIKTVRAQTNQLVLTYE
ncbi:MAG: hypothetical protein ACKVYV_11515 [Limisphaerales bacterium]